MRNLRLSVTALDSFQWFKHSEQEPEDLMRRLRGEEPPSPEMARGRALHTALETAVPGEFVALEADGFAFNVLGSVALELPDFREVKAEYPIKIDNGLTVTLVGKVDAFQGRTIYDHKGTSRFEAEYLLDTFQWRYYLEIFGADTFQFNVFVLKQIGLTEYDVTDFHKLRSYRYPNMREDCIRLLRDFLTFLDIDHLKFPRNSCPLATLLKANI
jgi:hypothetical protein